MHEPVDGTGRIWHELVDSKTIGKHPVQSISAVLFSRSGWSSFSGTDAVLLAFGAVGAKALHPPPKA